MREWLFLVTVAFAAIVSVSNAGVYPWLSIAPWWVPAPEKDTPPVVNIQQLGGNYAYSTAEGKAFHALAPIPPVSAVHVPGVAVHYLPGGQAVPCISGSVAIAGNPQPEQKPPNDGSETTTEFRDWEESTDDPVIGTDYGEIQEESREPAPVTEHQEENEAKESAKIR